MSGESGDCDIRIWICSKENVQGKKEPGTYCCCGGSGDFDDAAWTLHGFVLRSIENAMGTSKGDVAEQYATQLLLNEKNLEEDWIRGYSYVQIDLHPDIYRVGFSYYADQKDAEVGKESMYGYDIQVDSDYKITIKEGSSAIGMDLWSEKIEG